MQLARQAHDMVLWDAALFGKLAAIGVKPSTFDRTLNAHALNDGKWAGNNVRKFAPY